MRRQGGRPPTLLIGALLLTVAGCGGSDEPEGSEPSEEPTTSASAAPDGEYVIDPDEGFCASWLAELQPVNADRIEYEVDEQHPGEAVGFDSGGHCDVDPTGVPEAAQEGLDMVTLRLEFADTTGYPDDWQYSGAVVEQPLEETDWAAFLTNEYDEPLRGELACWEISDCEPSGEADDGRLFRYEFEALHRNLHFSAQITYMTPGNGDQTELDPRTHALDLFGAYAEAASVTFGGG
ncbi:hypothetical protein [Glycomyces arizonensis]|uniref:hypothetical protein n=1 Tax=Glycomyces arizonensis TaxID=256035 RepID=UPI000405C039|nr:hypothetical protein [Glycomyces arizonensis]